MKSQPYINTEKRESLCLIIPVSGRGNTAFMTPLSVKSAENSAGVAYLKAFVLIALLIFLFFPVRLNAVERLELSLEAAVNYAVDHNKSLQNASFATMESRAALRSAIAQGLPQIDAQYDYQNFFNSEANIGPMSFVFTPTSNLNFRVGQLVFSGSYIVGIQMSMLYRDMADVNLRKTDTEIRSQVTKTYYLVLVTERSKEILQENLENLSDLIKKTEALVRVGVLDETDSDQIRLQKTMLENSMRTTDRQYEMALNLLRMQLGVTAGTEIVLTESLTEILLKTKLDQSLSSVFNVNTNNDFQLMLLQREIARKNLLMEKTAYLPTVAGFYNYTEKIQKPELDFAPKHVIGFNISFPIFSGGTRYYNHARARIQLKSTENQLELLNDQLSIQEKQLRYNLKSAIEQYEAQKENIELAKRLYNNIYLKYRQGVVSALDITTANASLLQAENGYIMAVMQLLEAQLELDKLLNRLKN